MIRHSGIPASFDDRPPRAPATGPFARRPFLSAVTEFTAVTPVTVEEGGAALVVVEEAGEIRLAGEPDLTDYHCPVGSEVKAVVTALVEESDPDTRFRFDSLPGEVVPELVEAFEAAGLRVSTEVHEAAAVIEFTGSYDDYLGAIGKKQRHEMRRKRRRYEESLGEVVHEVQTSVDWGVEEFFRLHRMAEGAKGGFMTPEREGFFRRLLRQPGWRLDLLVVPGEQRAAACCFSYVDDEGAYLYNSSYDLELREASPGVVMIGVMIEQATAEGLPRFDFLKGDETYKFRLGAHERPLHELVAVR